VVVHAYVLLHFVMLAGKVGIFDVQLRAQIEDPHVRTTLRRQLPSNVFVQFLAGPREWRDGIIGFLLWLIAFISLVIGAVLLLVFFQLQSLPYHDAWITWWQRIAVAVDLALLWTLWPRVGMRREVSSEKSEAPRGRLVDVMQRRGMIMAMVLISVISVPLVFAIATFPGEWLEEKLPPVHLIPTTWAAWTYRAVQAIQTAGSVGPHCTSCWLLAKSILPLESRKACGRIASCYRASM
jgi:hypothetical protein